MKHMEHISVSLTVKGKRKKQKQKQKPPNQKTLLQLKPKAETKALGKCAVVTKHRTLQEAVHMKWDSNERSQIRDNAEHGVLLWLG